MSWKLSQNNWTGGYSLHFLQSICITCSQDDPRNPDYILDVSSEHSLLLWTCSEWPETPHRAQIQLRESSRTVQALKLYSAARWSTDSANTVLKEESYYKLMYRTNCSFRRCHRIKVPCSSSSLLQRWCAEHAVYKDKDIAYTDSDFSYYSP